jgi:hypothetical protein
MIMGVKATFTDGSIVTAPFERTDRRPFAKFGGNLPVRLIELTNLGGGTVARIRNTRQILPAPASKASVVMSAPPRVKAGDTVVLTGFVEGIERDALTGFACRWSVPSAFGEFAKVETTVTPAFGNSGRCEGVLKMRQDSAGEDLPFGLAVAQRGIRTVQ